MERRVDAGLPGWLARRKAGSDRERSEDPVAVAGEEVGG